MTTVTIGRTDEVSNLLSFCSNGNINFCLEAHAKAEIIETTDENSNRTLCIHGSEGVGKTVLLTTLYTSFLKDAQRSERVFFHSAEASFTSCDTQLLIRRLLQLAGISTKPNDHYKELQERWLTDGLKAIEKSKKEYIILIDALEKVLMRHTKIILDGCFEILDQELSFRATII